jgi:pimeloyl-ACP methyl ester carboxylesterase
MRVLPKVRLMAIERFINVSGRRIWTRQEGSGPPVLLSLGAGHPGVGYSPEIEKEVSAIATVITYDRAGMGRSDPPRTPPTASDMVEDIRAVIETLGVAAPVLLTGFSLTALAAQLYACRYPSAVAGLVLLDPTPDIMVAQIADQPASVREAARRNLAPGEDISRELAFELERIIESAVELRDAIVQFGLPDVPFSIVMMQRKTSSLLMHHHMQMIARVQKGTLVTASATSHRTFVAENAGLISRIIARMLG